MTTPYPPPMTTLDFGPEPHSTVTQWAKRAAHFETWKAKQK